MMMVWAKVLFWASSSLLILSTIDAQRTGDLRLVRYSSTSSSYSFGRLEIYINGRWGTVCDDGFSSIDASVACRQLGYSGGSTTGSSSFGSAYGTIWLDDVGCVGGESCLLSCATRAVGTHNCVHSEDVAISCYGTRVSRYINCGTSSTTCTSSQFRCDSGQCVSSSYRCNGVSGGCSDGSDERGCSCSSSQFRCDNGRCVSSSVRCNGVTGGCSDGSDERGCPQSFGNGNLRLARGSISSSTYSSGRLEIYINGRWGTVCDDSFGYTDANVACRQLGYSGASSNPVTASSRSSFGSGSGQIWLDDVGCTGSESCLLSCYNRGIGVDDCSHSEDVAIYCSTSGTRSSSNDCSFIGTEDSTGAVVGGIVGGLLVLFCLISICCAIPSGVCYVKKSSKRRTQRSVAPTTATATLAAPYPTATLYAANPAKPGTSYPTTGLSPYPSQPPPQPGASPSKPTAYPAKGQDLPPPCPGQAFEMQQMIKPAAGSYTPQAQVGYPPQLQAAYPPQLQAAYIYPPGGYNYPEQTVPCPAQAPNPAAPSSTDPNQTAPSPTDLNEETTP